MAKAKAKYIITKYTAHNADWSTVDKYQFHLMVNGRRVLKSEDYGSRQAALKAIESVRNNSSTDVVVEEVD